MRRGPATATTPPWLLPWVISSSAAASVISTGMPADVAVRVSQAKARSGRRPPTLSRRTKMRCNGRLSAFNAASTEMKPSKIVSSG